MLYKRSKSTKAHWWTRFSIRGREIRQSSGTNSKALAEVFEQKLRERLWREKTLGEEIHFWEEATERWLKEKAHKRSLVRDKQAFVAFNSYLAGRALIDVEHSGLHNYATDLLVLVSAGTVARHLAAVRAVLHACVKWGWLLHAPKVELPHVKRQDPRWITQEQFEALCKELPHHARPIARLAVATGLRSLNVFRLRWSHVDLELGAIRVQSADAKSGRGNSFPLNGDAQKILENQQGLHAMYVFVDHLGRAPIRSLKTCWKKACIRAGLPGLRFHDLRHTWAAWHVLAGTPPMILKELGGWASLAMVERYGAINPGHLSEWADNSSIRKQQ